MHGPDFAQIAQSSSGTEAAFSEPAFFSDFSSPKIHLIAAWQSTALQAPALAPSTDANSPSVRHSTSSDDGASGSIAHGSCDLPGRTAATASRSADSPGARHGIGRPQSWHWGSIAEQSDGTSRTYPSQRPARSHARKDALNS